MMLIIDKRNHLCKKKKKNNPNVNNNGKRLSIYRIFIKYINDTSSQILR